MTLPAPPLLVITDRRRASRPIETVVAAALSGGCRWVSVREKDLRPAERAALVARIVALARPAGATVSVHGDVAAALAAGADGVHLPAGGDVAAARRRLGRRALVGVSTHSVAELSTAGRDGADYATLSPIFPSASKPGYGPPLGCQALREAAGALPILALGGVAPANAGACLAAGADGIAVMGAIMAAIDPQAETVRLLAALRRPR